MSDTLRRINETANRRLRIWRDYRMEGDPRERVSAIRRLTLKLEGYWQTRRRERAEHTVANYDPGVSIPSSLKAWLSRTDV